MSTAMLFDFTESRKALTTSAWESLKNKSTDVIVAAFGQLNGSELEKRSALDQAVRDVLKELIVRQSDCKDVLAVISLSIDSVTAGVCSASTPFLLLGDLLDGLPLDQCDHIFTFVEQNVGTWKASTFYSAGKNYLLRMCNDLLRRLSKSQNTVFCGRIQLFLARLFPLSEKSGLNLQSQFNLENVTVFNTNETESTLCLKVKGRGCGPDTRLVKGELTDDRDDTVDIEEGEMGEDDIVTTSSVPIDYNLYRKFWSLQDFFRCPLQCYDRLQWRTFSKFSEEVLTVFKSFKLDDAHASSRVHGAGAVSRAHGEHAYFAKFLTSEKLMDLQLSDSNFRRHVLLQHLLLFQYLKGQVKFKSSTSVLTDEQSLWIEDTIKHVFQLLKETPPEGDKFSKAIEHILAREENWITWKNEGCPSFVKERPAETRPHRPRKRAAPEDFLGKGSHKKILMGSDELTRLWNLCPDNMEACKAESREFLPSLEEFFDEAIEQADPESMVDREYKVVNDSNYGWRALRLLSRRSPHFFQPTNQQFRSLPEYLENIVTRLAREMPPPSEEIKTEDEQDNDDGLLKDGDSPEGAARAVTSRHLEACALLVGARWRALVQHLQSGGGDDDEEEDGEGAAKAGSASGRGKDEDDDEEEGALEALLAWQEREGPRATVEALHTAISAIGFSPPSDGSEPDTEGDRD
ncbi:THO complex subunit 1 isoform X1 [Lampetra planeri]